MVKNMPKLESPFIRKEINGRYICTPEIAEGYEWVFNDTDVRAVEKLHGTNVSIIIERGRIVSIWNRTEEIPFFNKSKCYIVRGVIEAYERGYCDLEDGQWFGELIGEKLQGNPYGIKGHLWIPFKTYCWEHLYYKSWGKYPKDFVTISNWFKELMPLYSWKIHGKGNGTSWTDESGVKHPHFVEGIVFTHPDERMAKLRKDMFSFWYEMGGKAHKEEMI